MANYIDIFEVKNGNHGKILGFVFKSSIDDEDWAFVFDSDTAKTLAKKIFSKLNGEKEKEETNYLV